MTERPWHLPLWVEPDAGAPRSPIFPGLAGVVGAVLGGVFTLQAWWTLTAAPGLGAGPRVVEIPRDLGVVEVGRLLGEAGVIRSPMGFVLLATWRGSARTLKAGEYQLPRGANTLAVLTLLEGGRVLQHVVRLREGAALGDLARIVEAERLASAAEVLRVAQDPIFLRALGVTADSLEGYLFPDTYRFVKGMTPEDMLARMVARMRDQLSPALLAQAEARGLSVHQLLTLASIIEREAVERREMRLISAVFWNRLRRGMPLQADPTVQYAVGKEWRALTRADLGVESPFNTYRRPGLPPAPIANPGRAAIEAAVNPARTDYLYFVAMNEREHRFSTTLADHNAAVARYRVSRVR
jgi:UPF0755 protein